MSREQRPVTDPVPCRSCQRPMIWIEWAGSGKKMPVDAEPTANGNIVLTLRGGPYGKLIAEKFDGHRHDPLRNRYTSHFATCPNAKEHRNER